MAQFSPINTAHEPAIDASLEPTILTVPGLGGSGPSHWQTRWEESDPRVARVDMGDWDAPNRNLWVNRLNLAVHRAAANGRPVILVAHSLGCLTVAWWAHYERPEWADPVIGALLVAPPEVDNAPRDPRLLAFAPTPLAPLPFPSVIVASRDDPWSSLERSRRLAVFWGSRFVDGGTLGHINAESSLGDWRGGQHELARLARLALSEGGSPGPAIAEPLTLFA